MVWHGYLCVSEDRDGSGCSQLGGSQRSTVCPLCRQVPTDACRTVRTFVAASLPAMWRRYCCTPPQHRHLYEVTLPWTDDVHAKSCN